ncbi:GNAT family N-acetyltransferase/peptidase C39 family protein [Oceanobacter mangrovi]|uniref:GNAT family N-acetyltransferase/peptidase C39 family protein n=1 Tax=Oceanobacter mangrovi TaxID=2862510 RepID=UPI001C8DDB1C|nr:GNAT family N-acetyltransferase/peptidase C39 family protein [Oceanobacter mangrovi]
MSLLLRSACRADLASLLALEKLCFDSDRLSRRSFIHFMDHGHAEVLVAEEAGELLGYAIVMFRRGTWLARVYSLAVNPNARGKGVAKALMEASEQAARDQQCRFIRLEVSTRNEAALGLYKAMGYRHRLTLPEYYENGDDGWRMEKILHRNLASLPKPTAYYEQTTDFTCGPACLMMALKTLNPNSLMNQREELQIWREATTIFMTSGHGGCSPYGLALSAFERGAQVALYAEHNGIPFVDSVRDQRKKVVIERVHQDFLGRLQDSDVVMHHQAISREQILQALGQGKVLLMLISTWRLNRNKAPHWVVVTAADDRYVYLTDPDFDKEQGQSPTDYVDVPIGHDDFMAMTRFGRQQLRAALVIGKDK